MLCETLHYLHFLLLTVGSVDTLERQQTAEWGKRRRWDSNPRGLFTLHDFQSCSLGLYETPPAERVGFEPTRAIHPTAFRERHFRPLRHLSAAQYSISPGVRQAAP